MKITDKLKSKLKSAKSADEVQTILKEVKKGTEEAGVVLSDEDLDQASGGGYFDSFYENDRKERYGK